jgi:hypothetical protein
METNEPPGGGKGERGRSRSKDKHHHHGHQKEAKGDEDAHEKGKRRHRRKRRSRSRSRGRSSGRDGGRSDVEGVAAGNDGQTKASSHSRGRRSRSSSRGRSRSSSRSSRSSGESRSSSKDGKSKSQTSRTKSEHKKHGRKKHGTKGKSVKDRPSDWSREELMEKVNKLAKFQTDKVTGAGLFECVNKRLLSDDVDLYFEVMRRYNEVQRIIFRKCLISDEGFQQLIGGLQLLRHLRFLDFSNNLLTKATVTAIIASFGTASRRLESIDLRLNNLSEEDGILLYRAFSSIGSINGIPISESRTNLNSKSLSLTDRSLRQCEMGIMACLLSECRQLTSVDLSKNQIDSKGISFLMDCVQGFSQISSLNLSNNPLTYPEIPAPSLSGIKSILAACKNRKHICEVVLDGVKYIPDRLMAQIITSTMVNRSIKPGTTNRFEDFAEQQLVKTAPLARVMPNAEFIGGFDIDFVFCRLNNIPERHVEVTDDGFFITTQKFVKKPKDDA